MSDEYYTSPIFQASQPKRAPYTKNPTFLNSVSAAWQLEPVGQVGRDLWYGKPTYLDLPYDPPQNIQEQIKGYEQYYDSFTDIRNQEHLDFVKEKIDYHNHLRQVRDVGGLIPEIVAAFGDPINYTPIVWVKGISLAQRFVRGGAIIGGLTAAAEPIRHAYDPTATGLESAMYIGGSAFLGGGFYAMFARRGPRDVGYRKSPEDKADDIFSSIHDTENDDFISKMYDRDSDVTYNIGAKTYDVDGVDQITKGEYDLYEGPLTNLESNEVVKIFKKGEEFQGETLTRDLIAIDENLLVRKFNDGSYVEPDVPGAAKLPEMQSANDYKKFLIKKAHIKKINGAPKGKDDIDSENLLNLEVKTEMEIARIGRQTAGRDEGRSWFAENVDRWITDMGALLNNKIENKELNNFVADFAMRMFGDMGTSQRAAKAGYSVPMSALTKATANHFKTIGGFDKELHRVFQMYRTGVETVGDKKFGYSLGSIGIRAGDFVNTGLEKIGLRDPDTAADRGMTFKQFNEAIYKVIVDDETYKIVPKEIQEFADKVRNIYIVIGEEAERLGMFHSQGSIRKLREQWDSLVVDANRHMSEFRLKYPKDKKGLEQYAEQLEKAVKIRNELLQQEKNIVEGLEKEFTPLVKNYVNRVFDIDKINDEVLNEVIQEAPLTALQRIHGENFIGGKPGKSGEYEEQNLKQIAKDNGYTIIYKQNPNRKEPLGGTTNHQSKTIYINRAFIKKDMWPKKAHLNPRIEGVKPLNKKLIRNEFDLERFILAHEVHHILYRQKESKIRTKKDYENYINEKTTLFMLAERTGGLNQKLFSIPPNRTNFRGILYNAFSKNVQDDVDIYLTNLEVNKTISRVTRDGTHLNMDNDLEYTNNVARQSAFQRRTLDIEDKILAPYLIRDINYLVRMYSERMHKRIEMTKAFGDPTADAAIWKARQNLLNGEYKGDGKLEEINAITTRLKDARDKYYGLFNTADPDSFFGSRLPHALRNWGSVAMMGKVVFASVVDFARVPLVHGVGNTFRYLNSKQPFAADKKQFNEQIAEQSWLGDVHDVVMNNASARYIGQTDYRVGRGQTLFSRFFDKKVGQPLEDVQSPYYHGNLLSVWTQMMKEMSHHISMHRFLEDSQKVAEGKASKFELARLADYGISKAEARAIGRLPMHRSTNGFIYTKQEEWSKIDGAIDLADKLRFATFADVQRTIITPSIADKPNMMFGVIRIQNEGLAEKFDNEVFRFLGGYEKTEFGGKFNNGWIALPFQFFAWSFAANRKLLLSGLSNREMNLASGIIGMILFAALGDYLKNPTYYQHKSTEEKIYRAIEMSGVLGLPADINFSLEVISEGLFETPLGVRPSLGIPNRFGEANVADGISEFTGPGPGQIIDLIHSFGSDVGLDQKAQTIRRLIPFNNVIYLDSLFKKITDILTETVQ